MPSLISNNDQLRSMPSLSNVAERTSPDPNERRLSVSTDSQNGAEEATATKGEVPDFFSREVFRSVLRNPSIAHQLSAFCQSRFCGEHSELLERITKYQILLQEVSMMISEIHDEFFAPDAENFVNVPQVWLLNAVYHPRDVEVTIVRALMKQSAEKSSPRSRQHSRNWTQFSPARKKRSSA
jgi:hypothetical protein